ncbi:unnamed protein product [Thlaspi arvense]|uniref:Defective in cullin neddylation protein n=1 Tax=Thlaspi arvense TaxID=13288 RepID=A0AAU9R7L4_THLAR|nr:unnamed protein product [Thlaspi arvense]
MKNFRPPYSFSSSIPRWRRRSRSKWLSSTSFRWKRSEGFDLTDGNVTTERIDSCLIAHMRIREKNALQALKACHWHLEAAFDVFYSQPQPRSNADMRRLEELYNRYKGKLLYPYSDMILADVISVLCNDLQVEPQDIVTLVLSWHMNAATACEFSKEEFVGGLQSISVDSIAKLQEKLSFMRSELKDERRGGTSGKIFRLSLGLLVAARMNCVDNTGAKNLYVISVKGIKDRLNWIPYTCVVDMVMATVKKGKPDLRKKVLPTVMIRQCKPWHEKTVFSCLLKIRSLLRCLGRCYVVFSSAITGLIGKECADLWPRIASAAKVIVYSCCWLSYSTKLECSLK